MNADTEPVGPASTSTIVEALDKNKDATEEVKKVADDLLVVQAVLKDEIAKDAQPDLVGRAVEQAAELEKRLTKSAELLDEVNESLEQAIQEGDAEGGAPLAPPAQDAPRH